MKTKLKLFLISCFLILGSSLFAQNHWTPEPEGSEVMNGYVKVSIDGTPQDRSGLEIAAFCDGKVRGVAIQNSLVLPFGTYYAAGLDIKNPNQQVTRFKVYDPETSLELVTDYTKIFTAGDITGNSGMTNPLIIDFFQSPFDPTTIVGYSQTMTLSAAIAIDGVLQEREDLQLAVFSGDNLRGFMRPVKEYDNDNNFIIAQFTAAFIEGNTNGEPLTYRLYDPILGQELIFDPFNYESNTDANGKCHLPSVFTPETQFGDEDHTVIINFLSPASPVAQIGSIKYLTLNDAVDAVQNGQTITVISDFSQTEAVEFPAGMNLTLDLNGYDVEVSGEGSITVSGNLTLVDNAGDASFTTTESNFIINEGAQFYHTMAGINATAVKSIEQTTDGWDGIASPMTAESILNIETNGINELYYYDETGLEQNGLEWVAMAETSDNSYTLDEAGRGYLYANSVDPNQPQYESSFSFDFEDGTLNGWDNLGGWMLNSDEPIDGSYDLNLPEPSSDGYLVTQNQYAITNSSVLSFDVVRYGARSEYVEYKVFISTDGSNYNRIYTGEAPRNSYETIELKFEDYSEFVGNNVFIAFLYSEGDDSYGMFIDNIRLTSGAKSARADDGAILNFAGVLNNEDVDYTLSYTPAQNLKGFHLLGNPFAHNINVMNVWNETLANGYYAISNRGEWLARSTDNVAEVIAPMEAFLIKAGQAGKLTIRKSAGAKRSSSNGSLMISVTNGELRDDAYVSFNAGIGLDKISHRNENAPMLYIPAQDKNYAVAVMDKEVKEIPLSFEAKQMGQYTISAEALNCEFEELYLIDKQTGTTTNLNLEDYTFIARTGDDEERFVITKSLSGTNPESHDESFIYIDNGDLVVKNIEGEGHVRVFDVLGRPVAEFMAVESARISTERFGNGIYVIQMSDENGVKVQKILID